MSIAEMEKVRSELFAEYCKSIGTPKEKEIVERLRIVDESIDAVIGYEAEEEADTSTNWDEWNIDNAVDRMREEMPYEV